MNLTADIKGRLTCRDFFKPGKTFHASRLPDGRILLHELVKKQAETPKVRLVRNAEKTFLVGRKITQSEVNHILEEFP